MADNPFDELDDAGDGVLQPAPPPGLLDRFRINYEAGQRYNTVFGAIYDAVPGGPATARQRFDARYEAFPEWQGFLEGGAALAGQLVGTAASPENFLPLGLGHKLLVASKMGVTGLWAKVFAGAVDGAAMNAAADLAIQGIEMGAGHREAFDPVQYGAGVLLGGVAGGAGGAVARGLEVRGERRAAGELYRQAAAEREGRAANPFDALDEPQPVLETPTVAEGGAPQAAPEAGPPAAAPEAQPAPTETPAAAGETPAETPLPMPDMTPPTVGEVLSDAAAAARGTEPHPGGANGINFRFFDPTELEVDPERFQFKAGGDEAGVTDRLRGVQKWQPERAGVLVVWEDKSGRRFVADGHQRSGLARRISAETGEKILVPGYVYREADGFSAEDVRTIAALKNIAEGSGTAIDAAKVLRAGGSAEIANLPPTSALVRDAVGMTRLSDDAFTMAVNEVVKPQIAAVVGRMVENEKLHAQILSVLKTQDAGSIAEAESMVRDILSVSTVKETQETLFGESELERLLLKERAQVRAAALGALKRDRKIFGLLEREADRVSGAGNVLDTEANRARAKEDAILIEVIERLATRAGPIADAFDEAARAVAGGQRAAQAARAFVEAVRAEIERAGGNLGVLGEGGSRAAPTGRVEADAEARPSPVDTGDQSDIFDFLALPRLAGTMRGERARAAQGTAGAAGTATRNIKRVRETAEELARALGVAATRQGRLPSVKGIQGVYRLDSGVVRVRSLDDFDVLTHEYGHHVEKRIPGMTQLMKRFRKELAPLDYDPTQGRPTEGFAEFFRLWLTNRPYARTAAPGFAAAFDAELARHPEMRAKIEAVTEAWDAFLSAPSTAAVSSTIVSSKRGGWMARSADALRRYGVAGTVSDVLQRIYGFLFDDLHPLARAVRALQVIHYENTGRLIDLKVSGDAYKLARMSRGAYAAGHMDVMYGVSPYRGLHPSSPSLRDAIVEATGKPNALSGWDDAKVHEFASYLWSRRALGEWERFRKGEIPNPPDKLTQGDHELNVKELEAANPQFASAAEKVHQFAQALWKKKFDAGLIDQTTYEDGLKIRDYVPGMRDWTSSDTDQRLPSGRPRGKTAKGGFARRFRGSKRDVINPLESLAADAYETAMAIARNDVVKAIDRLARLAGPGSAAIAEPVPAKQMRATLVDPLEAVETAARNAGLAQPDIVVLRDAVESAIGDEKAAIFRPAIINEKGEPIVFFRDGGQLKALRLADGAFGRDLYRTLAAMSQVERNFWVELVAMPARLLRAGITTSLDFIGANFIRDQAMAAIYYGKPLRRIRRSLQGVADDFLGSGTARTYARVAGLSGGAQTASLPQAFARRDLDGLARKGWTTQRLTSLRGLLQISEFSETASRLGLFRTFMDEAKARGLSDMEAALEASWRARDYIDFDRRGSGMAVLARVIPFMNVALQGLDKTSRHMIVPLARKMLGHPMTPEDNRNLGEAVKAWARLAALTAASVSLYAIMSRHEDHDEISETTRATHWMIKAGEKWVAVPKPFEFATVINLAEAAFDAMAKNDPAALGRWRDSLWQTVAPPSLLEGNPALKSYFEIKTNTNFFTDAPIVPEHLIGMEPFMQYTARTSALSRQLGEAFNVSPAIIDHLVTAHLGSWGRNLLALYDLAQPDAPAPAWDDAPISRRFIKDAAKGSQSVTRFWQEVGERQGRLEGAARTWRVMVEADDAAGAADYLASLDDQAKAFVTVAMMDAKVRRLHPLVRAREAIRTIGVIRRDMAAGRLRSATGEPIELPAAARTAADDVLSTLAMAIARNALAVTDTPGWAQRAEIPEDGFYRELEAISPELTQRLADGYATSKVWRFEAIKEAWPELRSRVLAEGSEAPALDLVVGVEAAGTPIGPGLRIPRRKRPEVPAPLG